MGIRDWFSTKQPEQFTPLRDEHKKRRELFATYWKYYRGHHKRFIQTAPNGPDDNVILNYSKEIVDQGIDFLFGEELTFEIDSESKDRTPEEQYLDIVWGDAETKMTFLQKLGQNGAVTGTAFLRLYPADPVVSGSLPRLVNLEPGSVDVITAADDAEQVVSFHVVWQVGDVWKRERIDYIVEGDYWTITPERSERMRMWVPDGAVTTWDYPFPPIFTCQNLPLANSVWGISDLEDADLNDAINRVASNTNRIIRFHAHPKTVLIGASANTLETTAVNGIWAIEEEGASITNLEMQSDLVSSREYMRDLKTAYHKITSASELDPAQVNVGALSGFALRILYGPTLARNRKKQNTYGGMIKAVCKALFVVAGMAEPPDVKLVWKDALPSSGLEEAQTLAIDVQNGLSQATYLERRGYDPVVEEEKKQKERDRAMQEQQAMMTMRSPFQQAINDLDDDDDGNKGSEFVRSYRRNG